MLYKKGAVTKCKIILSTAPLWVPRASCPEKRVYVPFPHKRYITHSIRLVTSFAFCCSTYIGCGLSKPRESLCGRHYCLWMWPSGPSWHSYSVRHRRSTVSRYTRPVYSYIPEGTRNAVAAGSCDVRAHGRSLLHRASRKQCIASAPRPGILRRIPCL